MNTLLPSELRPSLKGECLSEKAGHVRHLAQAGYRNSWISSRPGSGGWRWRGNVLVGLAHICILTFQSCELYAQQGTSAHLTLPTGQPGFITDIRYSADGELLLTGSAGSASAVLWLAGSGTRLREFKCGAGSAIRLPMSINADHTRAVFGCPDRTVRLVDLQNGEFIAQSGAFAAPVSSVAFGRNAGQVVVVAGAVMLFDLNSNQILKRLPGRFAPKNALVSRSGECAVAWNDDIIQVADLDTWQYARTIPGISYFNAGDIADDCSLALLSGDQNLTYIADLRAGKMMRSWSAHKGGDLAVALSRDHRHALSGGVGDAFARVWSVDTGEPQGSFRTSDRADNPSVEALAMSPDDRYIVAAPGLAFGAIVFRVGDTAAVQRLDSHSVADMSLATSVDGRWIATSGRASTVGSVWIWDLRKGSPLILQGGVPYHSTALAFSPDNRFLAAGFRDGTLLVWRTQDWAEVSHLKAHDRTLSAICFLPDSAHLLTGSFDGTIRQWSVDLKPMGIVKEAVTGELNGPLGGSWTDSITRITVTPDSKYVLASGQGMAAALVEIAKRKFVPAFRHDEAWELGASSISGDGSLAVTAGNDGSVRIWNLRTQAFQRNLEGVFPKGAGGTVRAIAFSPDGTRLVTGNGSGSGALDEWDTRTGKRVFRFAPDTEGIDALTYSADGRHLIAGSSDGQVRLFERGIAAPIVTIVTFDDDTWSVVSPNGGFDAAKLEGPSLLHWMISDDPFNPLGIEVFTRDFFTPKLLAKLLFGGESKRADPVATLALPDLNRAQPQVEILDVKPEESVGEVSVRVRVTGVPSHVQTDAAGLPLQSGAFDLRLFRDGQIVAEYPQPTPEGPDDRDSWLRDSRILDRGARVLQIPHVQLPRRAGVDHVIFTAYAFNRDRVKSETSAPFSFPSGGALSPPAQPRRRRAYVITMGVNATQAGGPWDLSVAVPSAREAARLWRERLSKECEVIEINLMAEVDADGAIARADATKSNLRAILDLLAGREKQVSAGVRQAVDPQRRLRPATPDDAVVLHVASHGYANPQGQFFLIPFDTGTQRGIDEQLLTRCQSKADSSPLCSAAESFLSHAISSDDLAGWWAGVDGGDMVMVLDSCHSGAVPGQGFRAGPLGDRGFGQLAYDKGLRIFAATQPDKIARGTVVKGPATLLIEALKTAATPTAGQGISAWLRTAERMLPQRARQLYPTLNEDDLQWPELMDFRR
jgi:WD40 repeat protein